MLYRLILLLLLLSAPPLRLPVFVNWPVPPKELWKLLEREFLQAGCPS